MQDGGLVIDAVAGDMYGGNTSARNILGQPAPDGAWTATTKVTLAHAATYEQAGMLLRASDQDFLKLAYIRTPDGRNIEFIRQRAGQPDDQGAVERSPLPDHRHRVLRMHTDGTNVTAAYSPDGATWTPVGRSQPLDASGDATIGVSAFNGVGTPATFDFFSLADAVDGEPATTSSTARRSTSAAGRRSCARTRPQYRVAGGQARDRRARRRHVRRQRTGAQEPDHAAGAARAAGRR